MPHNTYKKAGLIALAAAAAAFSPAGHAALSSYTQNFESMTPGQGWPPNDLSADGWQVFGIVWDGNHYVGPAAQLYTYGPFEAADGAPGSMQGLATGEGGPGQGNLVLAKYSDYNNTDQTDNYIQALTFQSQTIALTDVGLWRFTYDAKLGNLEGDSSAFAYIQTIDSDLFFQKEIVTVDSTNLPIEWGTYTLELLIDESMVGDILNFGFSATATNYNGSGVFYDNLRFAPVPLPAGFWLLVSGLLGLIGVRRR